MPRWIVVRLGNDLNWWVEEASDHIHWPREGLSILDPRQLRDVLERLAGYEAQGFQPAAFAEAFQLFEVQSELEDGRLRLRPVRATAGGGLQNVFAMPRIADEDDTRYADFIESLVAMRVRKLNDTHDYARQLDVLDLEEELDAEASDRYFGGQGAHCYDEMHDILTWSPDDEEEAEEEGAGDEDEEERR
jgi:hypothetical protein